jgi:tetratricopeptide (TPR) repeat protein
MRMQTLREKCHLNLALTLYQLKHFDEALSSLRQVLLVNPKNVKAMYRIATIAYERDEFENCRNILTQIR